MQVTTNFTKVQPKDSRCYDGIIYLAQLTSQCYGYSLVKNCEVTHDLA